MSLPGSVQGAVPSSRIEKSASIAIRVTGTTAVTFSLACFSDAFLILRARDAGLPIALAPAVLVVMNVVCAATA